MNWTDERIAILKKMWAEGKSATQIAKELTGVSRNAVIGKAHRIGLGSRVKVELTPEVKPLVRTSRMRKSAPDPKAIADLHKIIDKAPPPVVDTIVAPKSLELTLMELERLNCRWPSGEHESITFCGHRVQPEKSWCPYHCRLAWGKGTESERTAGRALERAAA